MMTAKQTHKLGLSGRCFIVRDDRGRTKYQGLIHNIIPCQQGDLVLIQYFEAMFGQLNTMALVPLAEMVSPGGMGGYVLFEDDAHLRGYMEAWQNVRDERIDAKDNGDRL
jgi:hypothetical protein